MTSESVWRLWKNTRGRLPWLALRSFLGETGTGRSSARTPAFRLIALLYSDFIIDGRWGGVDEALRGIYEEASESLGP